MFRVLFFFLVITLFSSCVFYSHVKKDASGEYVTRKGVKYLYYRLDASNGYIIDETGKKIILTMIKGKPIKNYK